MVKPLHWMELPPARVTVVLAAHPDDEIIGCGSLLARRVREGGQVFILVFTSGAQLYSKVLGIADDPSPEVIGTRRKAESLRAAIVLGLPAGTYTFWEYPDGDLAKHVPHACDSLTLWLQDKSPEEIFCHRLDDPHVDHAAAAQISRVAASRAMPNVPLYQFSISSFKSKLNNTPKNAQNIEFWKLKRQALSCFRSHLERWSPLQQKPILSSWDPYLSREETFQLLATV